MYFTQYSDILSNPTELYPPIGFRTGFVSVYFDALSILVIMGVGMGQYLQCILLPNPTQLFFVQSGSGLDNLLLFAILSNLINSFCHVGCWDWT